MFTTLEDFGDGSGAEDLFKEEANALGWTRAIGPYYMGGAGGIALRSAYETMKAEILNELRAAMPVNMVVMELHGAMVAQGYNDVEGDLLAAMRDIVGPDVPIGAAMDGHAHLSQKMIDAADIMVFFKEWPHIDFHETRTRAFNLTTDVAEGKIKPHLALYDVRMAALYHTLEEPVKSVVADMKEAEKDEDVLVVNFIHGYPWADVPEMGTKMLVITNDAPEKGAALAKSFGQRLFALRGKTAKAHFDLEEGLDVAAASKKHPTIIADFSDMTSGGAPGDATFLLRGLMERGVEDGIIAGLWDPMAIKIIEDLSPGDRVNLRIGGKTGPMSGQPVDLETKVCSVRKNVCLNSFLTEIAESNEGADVGTIAVVRSHGIDIVLLEERIPIYGYKVLEGLGLDPKNRRFIVVKSGNSFYPGYVDIAGDVLYVMSPGLLGRIEQQTMRNIQRPKWPWDENPFE
jgi:microcystin degradation protein MlrC